MIKNKFGIPHSFEVHTSVNGMYRYGSLTVEDKYGIRESLPITGNEIITIAYNNATRGAITTATPVFIHFNIFNMEEAMIDADDATRFSRKALKFNLVEAPFFLKYNDVQWQKIWGKDDGVSSVTGQSVDSIILDHLQNDLQLNETSLFVYDFQKLKTKMHFCCPSWKTQLMLAYLLDFAKDNDNNGCVKLFTTSELETGSIKINMKSMNNMFKEAKTTLYGLIDVSSMQKSVAGVAIGSRSPNLILSYKFLTYDITSIPSGFSGAYLLNYDYTKSQYFTQLNRYSENNQRNKSFYNFALWSNQIDNDQSRQFYFGEIRDKSQGTGFLQNKITEHQYQLRCEMMTYVDETVQVGEKIFVTFLSGMAAIDNMQSHPIDEQMSGAWLIEEITDHCIDGRGMRKMVAIKDSFFNMYEPTVGKTKQLLPPVEGIFK
jgi:hypothetical protein